jgi:regulator of sigma E protease
MLTMLIAAAVVIGPVIVFHEFGHFIVAKLAGIYVKTFSVGFGPKLLKFRMGETQYALSAIPLGGYVKMAGDSVVDERRAAQAQAPAPAETSDSDAAADGDSESDGGRSGEGYLYPSDMVPDSEIPEHRYFRNKPLVTRLAVVTAGPIANFVLAVLVLTGTMWHNGMRVTPSTTLREINADSDEWAAGLRGGDVVQSIGGESVTNYLELVEALGRQGGEAFPIEVLRHGVESTVVIGGVRYDADGLIVFPDLPPRMDTRIGLVKKDGPAWKAGLRSGDRIVEIDGEPVHFYDELADRINPAIGEELQIVWERGEERHTAVVVPEAEQVLAGGDSMTETRTIGRIQIEAYSLVIPVSFGSAAKYGALRSWQLTEQTVRVLGELASRAVRGDANRDALGGPIRIAEFAADSLRWGPTMLLGFLAFFSVNLFLLNLLPIPVLDGGHVVFLLIEAVRGQPLSLRTQELALKVGVSALFLLMGFVVFNDIVRVLTG